MSKQPTNELLEQIQLRWPKRRWSQYNVIVAVSGGADSVALLRALVEIRKADESSDSGSLIVAHFNHQLRGADSDQDAEFVRGLADGFGLPFELGERKSDQSSNSENDFRDQRYAFLTGVARSTNSRYIATAHHRDDVIETVLFRLFRGTGLPGLCGIPETRVVDESLTIVRPMLAVDKTLIETSLQAWGQGWREDASNSGSDFSRNFIRNEALPLLRSRFANVDESIARLARQSSEQQSLLGELIEPLWESVAEQEDGVSFDCRTLHTYSPVLLRELVVAVFRRKNWPMSELGFRELDELSRVIAGETVCKRKQISGGINCESDGKTLRLWLVNKKPTD